MTPEKWLEARDRSIERLISYDMKVLTLLFGIAASSAALSSFISDALMVELVQVILAIAGLAISSAWGTRRRFLLALDDEIGCRCPVGANRLMPKTSLLDFRNPGAWMLRHGDLIATLAFVFFTALSVWTAFEAGQTTIQPIFSVS